MFLNWTIASGVLIFALIPEMLAAFISLRGYLIYHYNIFKFIFLTWFSLWLGNLCIALGYIFLNFTIYRIGVLISIPLAYSTVAMVDSFEREFTESWKLVLITIISSMLLVLSFEPGAIALNTSTLGELGPSLQGPFMYAGGLLFIVDGGFWAYYMWKIYHRAPSSIRKYAGINLLGGLLAGPGSMIVFASGLIWLIPGTDYLLIGCGAFLCAYAFWKEPKLGYVLPFKVYKLLVVQEYGSIPLYSHNWRKLPIDDNILFSGALSGISMILRESLGGWMISEIKFDQGRLIVSSSKEPGVIFVLITSNSTSILRDGLVVFQQQFLKCFASEIRDREQNLVKFERAEELIRTAFPFVVEY